MKWLLISMLVTAATFAASQGAPTAGVRANDEQAIIKLRDALYKAYDAGDVKTLSEIEDDSFTLAGNFGQATKQQHLDQVRHRERPQIVSRTIDNQFRFYGDMAILTEVDHAHGADGSADYQTTLLWIPRGNTWRVVHMHFSKIDNKP